MECRIIKGIIKEVNKVSVTMYHHADERNTSAETTIMGAEVKQAYNIYSVAETSRVQQQQPQQL